MKTAIKHHSVEEYDEISSALCKAVKEVPPRLIAGTFARWFASSGPLSDLRQEYESYVFDREKYPIRHLFAHFLAFQEDKFKDPEFFCWPAAWMVGDLLDDTIPELFEKHEALFVDREDDDGVYARIQKGRSLESVQATFEKFYHDTVTYGLTD